MRAVPAAFELPALALAAAGYAMVTAFALVEMGPVAGVAIALLPLLALGVVYLITSGQIVLYAAALALPILPLRVFGEPVIGQVTPQDAIAVLALGALVFATFLGRGRVPPVPRTPVLGWPFVFFGAAILIATLRGHYAHGASLVGQPLRLVLYAAIVAGLVGMTVPRLYRLLIVLFYPGAVLLALTAAYYLLTGGSQGESADLSTGGIRPLAISTSLYAAGALFLALFNLRLASSTRDRALHLGVAAIALFGVVAGFGRAAYAGVFVVGVVSLLASSRLRRSILSMVPLTIPVVILIAIGVSRAVPQFVDSVGARVTAAPSSDVQVQWRLAANRAILDQVRESPVLGAGFGKTSEVFLDVPDSVTRIPVTQRVEIGQDPHNGYLFVLAGGGILALGALGLLLGVFALDAARRYRRTSDPTARLLILWACATLFVFLFNAASGTSFESPVNVLTIWALLVLPAVVPPDGETVHVDRADEPDDAWLRPISPRPT